MATPHIAAAQDEIAKTVLMPGDPLRAKFIAETFLEKPVCVNSIRGMLGYTGKYHGIPVSVMGSGMGMPSIGIYSYELFHMYDVDQIIRIGSAGAYTEKLNLYEIFLAEASYSESSYAKTQNGYSECFTYPNADLNEVLKECAQELQLPLNKGVLHSTDVFYQADPENIDGNNPYYKRLNELYGCACVEMESFALFHNAMALNKKAACLVTISDSLVTGTASSAQERQTAFTGMMKIALNAIRKLN